MTIYKCFSKFTRRSYFRGVCLKYFQQQHCFRACSWAVSIAIKTSQKDSTLRNLGVKWMVTFTQRLLQKSVGWSHSYKMAHLWAYAKWSDKQLPIHSYEPLLSENQVLKTLHFSIWFFFFLTSVWFPTELVEMGKTQDSQDKELRCPAGRCLKHLFVINSQHTQEWLKTKPKPTPQCYPKDAQA